MKDETAENRVTLIVIGLIALFWILESTVGFLVFNSGTFWQQMFRPDPHEIWMRSLAIVTFIIFGVYTQSALTKRRRLTHTLNERVKELRCIYDITDIAERPGITLDKLYQEATSILPKGWQYPEITCARISVNGKMFETENCFEIDNCRDTPWKLTSDIKVLGAKAGRVEIAYLEQRPELDEGPFLREERLLIDAVAEQLGAITKRKHMEETIKRSSKFLETIFNSTNDAMSVINVNDFTIVTVNDAFLQQHSLKGEQVIGRTCYEITHHRSTQCTAPDDPCPLQDTITTGEHSVAEHVHYAKDGEVIYVDVSTSPIRDENGKVIQAVHLSRDITERKQAEKELRKHRDHLEELVDNRTTELAKANQLLQGEITERKRAEEKLQELYRLEQRLRRELEEQMRQRVEFTRALVHELKTPLTPMRAASELLIAECREDPWLSLVEKINRGTLNLNRRIDELLDLAKGEIGMLELKCRLVDPLQLLYEVADYVTPETDKKGHSLVLDLPPSLPALWCDQDRLRQVVLNLLNNAFKFTPRGGRITLRARQKDGSLRVEVQDTGYGISEDQKKQLFKPYHQLEGDKEHFGGLGLGLALCKTLVELHGGQICVESQMNKGSSFIFTIPLKTPISERIPRK
ncbi:MAG: PAS domain-containing sensor histidine kinase [Planctomycetota bacterium]|jgi:PAS domain S-box-containing protein